MADTEQDERRWQEAFAVLEDGPPPDALSAPRLAQTRIWVLAVGVVVVSIAAGAVLAVYLVRSPDGPDPSGARDTAGGLLSASGLVLIAADIFRRAGRGRFRETWRAPALVLSRVQRRSLARQVRGAEPLDLWVLPLARDLAARQARDTQLLMAVGWLLQTAGQALGLRSAFVTCCFIALLVLAAVTVPRSLWNARRASRFLQEHPSD